MTVDLDDLALPQTSSARLRDIARAPEGFEPSCMFLLRRPWANLFEPTVDQCVETCKGCGARVALWSRESHFEEHRRQVDDKVLATSLAKSTEVLYRGTTGNQPPLTSTRGDNTMNATTTDTKPAVKKIGKTVVAREAAVDILTKANKPMTMNEIVEKALKVKKVIDAGVPRGTLSAQINFALAENPPRIHRVGRGVYAVVGVEAEAPVEAAASDEVTPDPKPARKRGGKTTPAAPVDEAPAVEEAPAA